MQTCRHPNKLHEKKEKPCFRIMDVGPWGGCQTLGWASDPGVGVRHWGGRQTLVHPMLTCRHPNKLHERKEKPVGHGFHNEEVYPLWRQTLVYPTQICRHPNCMRRRRNLVSGSWASDPGVGVRPWYAPCRPADTQTSCMTRRINLCIMIFTMKKHIPYGIRPWYIPCRSADNQTNCMRRRRNLVSGLRVSDLGTPHTDPQTPKETA